MSQERRGESGGSGRRRLGAGELAHSAGGTAAATETDLEKEKEKERERERESEGGDGVDERKRERELTFSDSSPEGLVHLSEHLLTTPFESRENDSPKRLIVHPLNVTPNRARHSRPNSLRQTLEKRAEYFLFYCCDLHTY